MQDEIFLLRWRRSLPEQSGLPDWAGWAASIGSGAQEMLGACQSWSDLSAKGDLMGFSTLYRPGVLAADLSTPLPGADAAEASAAHQHHIN